MASLRLLLAGFGHVGRRLVEILAQQSLYPALTALDVTLVGITTGHHGALVDSQGLDPEAVLKGYRPRAGFTEDCPGFRPMDTLLAIRELDFDVLVELSPLSIAGKGEPAITHVREALRRGHHVVSANKGPVAWAFRELQDLAAKHQVQFRHEATVMDGAPIFNLREHCLRGNTILSLEGILNSTTNVVLGEMEQGLSLQEAILKAQAMGIAEADPSADLEGWDAAVKLSALANALLDADLLPEHIHREGISHLTGKDLAAALARGNRIKMVCKAQRLGNEIQGRVEICELPKEHPFARVEGADSVLRLHTDLLGRLIIAEDRPDLTTTAYGVIADLLALYGGV
jgi:homoserine dehydrogenase